MVRCAQNTSDCVSLYAARRCQVVSDASKTVWVKRMDVQGARYSELEEVDLQQTAGGAFRDWPAEDLPKARGSHRMCLDNTASRPRFA